MVFFQSNFIFFLSALLGLISIFIYRFIIKNNLFTINSHNGPQKIHSKPTSRSGGGVIYFSLILYLLCSYYFNDFKEFLIIVLSFLFIFIISLKEDIYKPTNPIIRLFLIFISSSVYIVVSKTSFIFETKIINIFLNIEIIQIIFLILIISTVVNGFNIFDGSNGHCSLIGIFYSIIILILSYKIGLISLFYLLLPFILFLSIFLIFNYPRGLIFLGDTGAYLIGWITSISVIYLLKNSNEISEIVFLNILFYPLMETIFSFLRKILSGVSPFKPDKKHLHLKTIFYLKKRGFKNFNSLNTIYLSGVWMFPVIFIPFIYSNKIYLIILLFFQLILYFVNYFLIKNDEI